MRAKFLVALSSLMSLTALGPSFLAGCGDSSDPDQGREEGQSEFQSAPPVGQGGGAFGSRGSAESGDSNATGGASSGGAPAPQAPGKVEGTGQTKPEETDLYRVEGDRLYYLNSYRGFMVFDIANVDDPKLLGRSPVFGTPVEMFVRDGVATVVVGDWYGNKPDGTPFHGSVVRTIDAKNPAALKVTGEVQVNGWARDMRVVGSNLYIIGEDYGWHYGYWGYYGYGGGMSDGVAYPGGWYGGGHKVVISSIHFSGGVPVLKGTKEYDGYSGAFNVTSNAIIMAHDVLKETGVQQPGQPPQKQPTGKSALDYIDITSGAGDIVPKGSFEVDGLLNGWSADNGRWNVDFNATTNVASVITCAGNDYGYCNGQNGYNLTTVDFTDANAPKKLGSLAIPGKGWAATARFNEGRMYLSPREGYYGNGSSQTTPVDIYDLSVPATPKLAGSTTINGAVWLFMPMGKDRLFALGNEYGNGYSSSKVALRYLDVTDAANPSVIGTSSFGDGWAWTPAAGTFKAFVRDATQKTIVLPFSGWSPNGYEYVNGVQLIEYDTNVITTKGAARSKGWVERGIFVKNRVVSLSDTALTVVDHTDKANPKVIREITLARNVISAQPQGGTIAQLSTDWYGYDQQKSEMRVLPIANAEEVTDQGAVTAQIDGTNARVFRNGNLSYVVTTKYPKQNEGYYQATPHVQVVDTSNGGATLRGSIDLPPEQNYYWGWWGGCYYWDWYDGSGTVQVNGDVLAFRRYRGTYNQATQKYETESKLYVVDLANADAPKLASTAIYDKDDDLFGWWGNMRVVGNTLYTSHYEYVKKPDPNPTTQYPQYWVRYYLDQIDLSDRNAPKVGKRINVPGMLVGASETDESLLYFVDYRWYNDYPQSPKDEISVAKIKDNKAYLRSTTLIDGWVGQVFVRGNKAYMSAEEYVKPNNPNQPGKSYVKLHELDLTDPYKPVDRASTPKDGWGWLVDVEGDRAIITSGWGQVGLDIYKLQQNAPPVYDQFARTRGWWHSAITRQDNDLFVSTGYWGVQKIGLK